MNSTPTKFINTINLSNYKVQVNDWWNEIGIYIANVLEKIYHDKQLLKSCYCEHRIREFDRKFLPSIFMPEKQWEDSEEPSKRMQDIVKMLDSRVILILGDVGTGKSTFVHYFFEIELPKHELWNFYYPIFVDYFGLPTDQSVQSYTNKVIDEELKKLLISELSITGDSVFELDRDIFAEDIFWHQGQYNRLIENGRDDLASTYEIADIRQLKKDMWHYNKRRMQYIYAKLMKHVVIVLDNVDHIPDSDKQTQAYLLGHSLAYEQASSVIMTMRTYNAYGRTHQNSTQAAFNPRYLHLSLPDVNLMMQKRVSYAISQMDIEHKFTTKSGPKVKVTGEYYAAHQSKEIIDALHTKENTQLMLKLAYFDLRAYLKIVHRALASAFLFPKERRDRYESIRIYDLVRALSLGNCEYFDPDDEVRSIINIFDDKTKFKNGKLLIKYTIMKTAKLLDEEYISANEIVDNVAKLGFRKEDALGALRELVNNHILYPVYPTSTNFEEMDLIGLYITQKGYVYLDFLFKMPAYYEIMRFASFVAEPYYSEMTNIELNTKFNRYKSAKIFIDFLIRYEKEWQLINKYTTEDVEHYSMGEHIRSSFNEQISKSGSDYYDLIISEK